jgi:hypothetical protein
LRKIRELVRGVLKELNHTFRRLYSYLSAEARRDNPIPLHNRGHGLFTVPPAAAPMSASGLGSSNMI